MEIDLKHYNRYLKRLIRLANALGLKVVHKDISSEGEIVPTRNLIRIDNDLPESVEIATLLHELGHAIDFISKSDLYFGKVDKAYARKKPNKKQKALIMKCERDAWNNARGLAVFLRIRLGKWFDDFQESCLNSYKNS